MISPHKMTILRHLFWGACIGILLLTISEWFTMARPIAYWKQPSQQLYGSHEPYTLFISHGPRNLRLFPFTKGKVYEIGIVRGNAEQYPFTYGYFRMTSLQSGHESIENYVKKIIVSWTK